MMIVSPWSRFRRLWCVIQRSAISATVSPCLVATSSMDAMALKYASFQYLVGVSESMGVGTGADLVIICSPVPVHL